MIRFLSVENLAVVDRLEVDLRPGLTVLTGETGAGKSVVIGALDLLFGGRASGDLIRTGQSKARVQASIEDEEGAEVVLRREVSSEGRSRAYIDDVLSTAGALRERATRLIDLHGQHDHHALLEPSSHLGVLDAYGAINGHIDDGADVAAAFVAWREARKGLERARASQADVAERRESLQFELGEIERISPEPTEDVALAERRGRLLNAERLRTLSGQAYGSLYESDDAILPRLAIVWRQLDELAELDPSIRSYHSLQNDVGARLEDLAFFLRSYGSQIDDSHDDLGDIETRLNDLDHLKRKYGPALSDVIGHGADARSQLEALEAGSDELTTLADREARAADEYSRVAGVRTRGRLLTAEALARELKAVLQKVSLPKAKFSVRFSGGEKGNAPSGWTQSGTDSVEFYFSANPGEVERPLVAVASGGELSRVMLGLKTLATTDRNGKTLVFDEIDAGIGGVVADRVGAMLWELSRRFQVICVTHLPQIAAYADTHFLVTKMVDDGRTSVRLDCLEQRPKRVKELARLMSGRDSPAIRAGADELLESKQTANKNTKRRKRKSPQAKGER